MWNPFKRQPDNREIDYRRGAIIALWAGIESAIDKSNHYGWLYSKKTASKVVPLGLRWKIDLFKKINRDLLPFAPLQEKAAELMAWADRRYDDRHWMAHGYIIPWKSTNKSWHFIKHEWPGDGSIKDLERTFTIDELITIQNDLAKLAFSFGVYVALLVEQARDHPLDDLGG